LVHEGSDGTEQENNYYQVRKPTMDNVIINMNLTPQEVFLIENIRSMQGQTKTEPVRQSDEQRREELIERYMNMTDEGFIDLYAEAVGDDTILAVLQDTMGAHEKWDAIWDAIDEDVINELFESYVSEDTRRELFFESQDRFELCSQLVDLIMDGD
jgi:hypothetical protein